MRGTVKQDAARKTWFFVIDNDTDPGDRKPSTSEAPRFKTRKAAENGLKTMLGDMRDGDYVEPSSQPLRVYLEKWLTTVEATRKPSTVGMYAHKMRCYVIPRIGGLPLRQVDAPCSKPSTPSCARAADARDSEGNRTPLSEQTVAVVHRILHRALSNAVKRGLIRSILRRLLNRRSRPHHAR